MLRAVHVNKYLRSELYKFFSHFANWICIPSHLPASQSMYHPFKHLHPPKRCPMNIPFTFSPPFKNTHTSKLSLNRTKKQEWSHLQQESMRAQRNGDAQLQEMLVCTTKTLICSMYARREEENAMMYAKKDVVMQAMRCRYTISRR